VAVVAAPPLLRHLQHHVLAAMDVLFWCLDHLSGPPLAEPFMARMGKKRDDSGFSTSPRRVSNWYPKP